MQDAQLNKAQDLLQWHANMLTSFKIGQVIRKNWKQLISVF